MSQFVLSCEMMREFSAHVLITQDDLVSLLRSAIVEGSLTGISGPFANAGTQIFIVKIPDERISWHPLKSEKSRTDASTHD